MKTIFIVIFLLASFTYTNAVELTDEKSASVIKEMQKRVDPLNDYCNHEVEMGWYKFKTTSNLTIRNRPSVRGKKIGLLKKGDVINGKCSAYDVLKNGVSGYWVYINEIGGVDQYVFGHYLIPVDTKRIPIPNKFIGKWDVGTCTKGVSDSKITIKSYAISFWESGGMVQKLDTIDSSTIEFKVPMSGEGENWISKFMLHLENDSLIMKRDDFTNTYVRCK